MSHTLKEKTDKRFSRNLLAASVFLALGGYSALSAAEGASPAAAPVASAPSSSLPAKAPKAEASLILGRLAKNGDKDIFVPDTRGGVLSNIMYPLPTSAKDKVAFSVFDGGTSRPQGPRKESALILDKYLIRVNSPGYVYLKNKLPIDSSTQIMIGEMTFSDAHLQGSVLNNESCILYKGCSNVFRLSLKDSSLAGDVLLNTSDVKQQYYPTETKPGSISLRATLDNAVLTGAAGREDVELMTIGDLNSADGNLHAGKSDIQLILKNHSTWNVKNHTQVGFNFSSKEEYKNAKEKLDKDTSTAYPKPSLEAFLKVANKRIRLANQGSQLTDLSFSGAGNTVNIDGTALQVMDKGIRTDPGASGQFNVSNKGSLKGDANLSDPNAALGVSLTTEGQWHGSVTTAPAATSRPASGAAPVAATRSLGAATAGTPAPAAGLRVDISGDGTAWTGDVNAIAGYHARIRVADRGSWTGKATRAGTANVDVAVGPGAKWTTNGNADVSNLAVAATGLVDATAGQLKVGALTLERGIGMSNISGNSKLTVERFAAPIVFRSHSASEAKVNADGLYQKDGKTFVLAKVADPGISGTTELGAWQYDVKAVKPTTSATTYDVVLAKSQRLSNAAKTALNMAAAPAIVARMSSDLLDSHLSASRRNTAHNKGAWLAFLGGNTRVATPAGSAFDMQTSGVMLGGETRLNASSGLWLAGGALSFARAGFNSGGTSAYGAHGYLSRRYDNGVFLDATAQYGHYRTSAKTMATDGQVAEGAFRTNGFGLGLKLGYDWRLASGAFVEPYAKLEGNALDAARYTLSNGMRVKSDGGTSVSSELGATAGYRLTGAYGYIEPYVHLAWMNTFSNANTVLLNNRINLDNSTAGSALRLGLGFQMKLTNNVGGYAGLSYTKGKHIEQPLQGTVGINVVW